jgi:hypothetical protein
MNCIKKISKTLQRPFGYIQNLAATLQRPFGYIQKLAAGLQRFSHCIIIKYNIYD